MQTTLLGIAIALILALLAALVGPHFVDWSQYRAQFEAQASRLSGLNVRITGPIDARLLPTPTLTLQTIEVSRPGDAGAMRARSLDVEFSLGPMLRGEWQASEVRLEGADVAVRVDEFGRLDWPVPALAMDPDSISIQRLDIVDSRVLLADVASNSHFLLEKLEFRGELRSLLGPVKGEGAFVAAGHHYPYRVSASRAGDTGVRVRLNLEPIDRPLIVDMDALISVEQGRPRYEGNLQLTRPVGRAADGIIEPWRITSRIKGDSASALLEQIEFQYGPDDRAIKLRGDASLGFGRNPQMVASLAATQVDLDRMLGLPEETRNRPLLAVRSFADYFGGTQRPPIPVKLGISVENVLLAGAMIQRVSGEVNADADAWNLDLLEFRAPGATQIGLSGRLNVNAKGVAFDGRAKVESRDTRALVAWLSERVDPQAVAAGALRAEGDVKLGSDQIAVDRLTAEFDRMTLAGRLSYAWSSGERPPRIEAALTAAEIDLDRIYALGVGILGDTAFEWPREGTLALKAGRAAVAGLQARNADVNMKFDRRGIEIERASVGDLGGAAISIKGHIDSTAQVPHGALTLDLDARALDGVATLVDRFAPQAAVEFRRRAERLVPAKVRASLSVSGNAGRGPAAAGSSTTFKLDGEAGAFKVSLQGNAPDTLSLANIARAGEVKININGRLDAADGGALVELLNLDRLVTVDQRPGRFTFSTAGPFSGDMTVAGQLAAGGLDISTNGTVRIAGNGGPTAALAIRMAAANLRSLRPPVAGRSMEPLSLALAAKLNLADGVAQFADIAGKAMGSDFGGRLKIGFAQPMTVDGNLDIAEFNLPSVLAAAIGAPANNQGVWPAEPFEQGLLGGLSGQVVIRSAHVALTPRLAIKNMRGSVHFDQAEMAINEIDGTLAGGRVAGAVNLGRSEDGVTAHASLRIANADLSEIIRGGPPPLAGRLTVNVEADGTGRSPVALIGALKGAGAFTIQDARALRLDPGSFDAVIHSVDQGLPIDAARIKDRMEQSLANGSLSIPFAEGEIAIAAGRAYLTNTIVRAQGAELAVSGSASLIEDAVDAKLVLSDTPGHEVAMTLKGPLDAPKRTLDAAVFSNWLALRAVEQQTKRIDALEAGRELPANPTTPAGAGTNTNTPVTTTPPRAVAPKRRVIPNPNASQTRPLDLRPPVTRGGSIFGSQTGP